MYKVAFVDNERPIVLNIQNVFEADFEIIGYDLKSNLDEMVDSLLRAEVDAYIFDFKFSDAGDQYDYDGLDLYNKIAEQKLNFPMVVLTSYEGEVLEGLKDPFHLAEKPIILQDRDKRTDFTKRLKSLIQNYKHQIEVAEEEIKKLIKVKLKKGLNPKEFSRLKELDSFIDRSISQKYKLPESLKEDSVLAAINKMLEKTEELISKQNEKKK